MIQTRNREGELQFFETIAEAMEYAVKHLDVWKVSFGTQAGERMRLIRNSNAWIPELYWRGAFHPVGAGEHAA